MEDRKISLNEILEARRKEINGFTIQLDKDASNKSAGILYRQRAEVKGNAERCVSIYGEIMQIKAKCERDAKQKKADFTSRVSELLITDKTVQGMSSKEMRQAAAEMQLKTESAALLESEKRLITVESFFNEVSAKLRDLYKTLEMLDSQMKSITTMIYLGEIRSGGASKKAGKLFDEEIENGL